MSMFAPNTFEFTQMERKLEAASPAYQIAQQRLTSNELQVRNDLKTIEQNFHPIRFISNQSNIKGHIIKKYNKVENVR